MQGVSAIFIIDFSQVILSNIMMQIGNHTKLKVEEDIVRHMVLNSIRGYRQKFRSEYGEMVVACDSRNYWRRKVFPYYKANRKKAQAASELNWKEIFDCLSKLRQELKDYFPYRVIDVDTAEADDVIGTLVMKFHSREKIMILSGDKDFIQLQRFANVAQYDPVRKRTLSSDDPKAFLYEHIIRGDTGDGIPNFLSNDNTFVVGERQKKITQKKLDEWLTKEPTLFCDELMFRNFKRNQQLIDLSQIPEDVQSKILDEYDGQSGKKPGDLMNYFITNKLNNLMDSMQEFV